MALHNSGIGVWRHDNSPWRARCHVSIRQSPSLCNAILNTCPCLLAIWLWSAGTPDRPWSIPIPDYNLTKQRCMKRIYDKIHPKSSPNLATSPTSLHCDVTHLSLTTGVVALHIPSWRIEVREERRQARKIVWPVNAGRVICRYQNNLCGIINHHKHIRYCFLDV